MEPSLALRLALLWSSTAFQAYALSSPNPPPSYEHRAKYLSSKLWSAASWVGSRLAPKIYRCILFSLAANETWFLCLRSQGQHATSLSPFYAVGCALVIAGSSLRLHCYRALGSFFTFQLAMMPEHKLVTHGAYGTVRHPSYTAILIIGMGTPMVYAAPGSALSHSLGSQHEWWLCQCAIPLLVLLGWVLLRRAGVEDRVLKEEFGKEWDEWARRVPYGIFPGLF